MYIENIDNILVEEETYYEMKKICSCKEFKSITGKMDINIRIYDSSVEISSLKSVFNYVYKYIKNITGYSNSVLSGSPVYSIPFVGADINILLTSVFNALKIMAMSIKEEINGEVPPIDALNDIISGLNVDIEKEPVVIRSVCISNGCLISGDMAIIPLDFYFSNCSNGGLKYGARILPNRKAVVCPFITSVYPTIDRMMMKRKLKLFGF